MIPPVHLPPPGASSPPSKARPATTPPHSGSADPQATISDARDPLIKDKPTFLQLSNHNADVGKPLTGLNAEPVDILSEPGVASAPVADADAAAASALSATRTILSQPGTALLAQANVPPSRAQRILS